MPPRPKFTKEEIVDAAYRIMETKGIDAVVAREVGRELGATVAPIFTYFKSMDELKKAVYEKAFQMCAAYLSDCTDYFPAFKEFGLRWIRFAKEHTHAYTLIFLRKEHGQIADGFINEDFLQMVLPVKEEIARTFSISEEDAQSLLKEMCIYVQGIASMMIGGHMDYPEDMFSISASRLCVSYVAGCHIQTGTLDEKQIRNMMAHMSQMPRKKCASDADV